MGNYHSSRRDNRVVGDCIITAVHDFAEDLLRASEIEYINIKEMEKENLPLVFYVVNLSIDKALKAMNERVPDMVPPMKEYKKRVEE